MSRILHGIEKGIRIYGENSDTSFVDKLFGAGAPVGNSGETDAAPIGSMYQDATNGEIYVKRTDTSSAGDWIALSTGSVTIDELAWRSEKVVALTNDTVSAGSNIDGTAWTDNDDGFTPVVGQYVIGDGNGSPALFEITAVVSPSDFDLAAAGQAIASNDTFIVQNYLPDVTGQENQAIFHVPTAGSAGVKIADVDWAIADAISLTSGYAAGSGNITNADSVNSAIEKLDGNNDAQDTTLGTAQGATDLGTFTGDIISDNGSVKAGMQELETELVDTRQNVDDLITLSGVAENSTTFGTFTGDSLADNQDAKALYQRIETLLEQMRGVQSTGITTITAVDSVPHASVKAVKWLVEVFEEATPANRKAFEVYALTDGTNVDDTVYSKIKIGANFNLVLGVAISGANMVLNATSSTAGVTVTARRIEVVKSVL